MAFYDFLLDVPRYAGKRGLVERLELRREFIVEPFREDLADARVLDLASYDCRWSYALAGAGAKEVIGVEARPELIAEFDDYPAGELKDRISVIQGDVFEVLPQLAEKGETFDVITIFGLYYHIMDHFRLLQLVHALSPRLIIIDSEFAHGRRAVISLVREDTDKTMNAIQQKEGQAKAVTGRPTRPAMRMMARALDYEIKWSDWDSLPQERRQPVKDYYRTEDESTVRRGSCYLRPRA